MDNPEGRPVPFDFDAAFEHFEHVGNQLRAGVVRPDIDRELYAGLGRRYVGVLGKLGSSSVAIKNEDEAGYSGAYQLDAREEMRLVKLYNLIDRLWLIDVHQPFWRGKGTEISIDKRYGKITDWLTETFTHFQNRPLAYEDFMKVLYAEEYDSLSKGQLRTRVVARLTSPRKLANLSDRLAAKDLKIEQLAVRYPTGYRKNLRFVCVQMDASIGMHAIDEATRPSDDELRAFAIQIRRQELESSQARMRDDAKDKESTRSSSPKPGIPNARRRSSPTNAPSQGESLFDSSKLKKRDRIQYFRSSIERSLARIVKAMPEHGKPLKGQTFMIADTEILDELLNRGLITPEEHDRREIDRVAVVAAMLIKTGSDEGYLSDEHVAEGKQIIEEEEDKYLQQFQSSTEKPGGSAQ